MTQDFFSVERPEYRFELSGRFFIDSKLRNTYNIYRRATLGWTFDRAISVPAQTKPADLVLHLVTDANLFELDELEA